MKLIIRRFLLVAIGLSLSTAAAIAADIAPTAIKPKAAPAKSTVPPAKSKATIEQGNALLDKEEYAAAVEVFSEVLKHDPKSVRALIGRGTSYRCLEKPDQALADFDTAIHLDPKNSEAHRGRGGACDDKKDYAKALAECEEAIRLDPKSFAAYRTRGCVHADQGDSEKALADYLRALELNPKDDKTFGYRAQLESDRGEIDKAISDLSKAIAIAPTRYYYLYNRGCLYCEKRDWDKAIADYSAAIHSKPHDSEPLVARATAYFNKNDFASAIPDLDEALRLDPKRGDAYRLRGGTYNSLGEFDKAIADSTRAIGIDPKNSEAYCIRGAALAATEDATKALADLDKLIALDPRYAYSYLIRGQLYAGSGKTDEALADYNRAIDLDPSNASEMKARALLLEKKGDLSKAEEDFAHARQMALTQILKERGLANAPATKATKDLVDDRIRAEVKRLEYSDVVANELIALVQDWKLPALGQRLWAAKNKQRLGALSVEELANAERETAETLCQELAAVVRYKENSVELNEVVRSKTACCMGYSLVYHVLGRAIGLDVDGLDVPIMDGGPTMEGDRHMACLVRLADGRVIMVDVAGPIVSTPFDFAAVYRVKGSYWELREAGNPPGLHQLVQPLNNDGLVAIILLGRAGELRNGRNANSAYPLVAEAIYRNPKEMWAYEIQGLLHMDAGAYDFAIADFSSALRHDPLCEWAYLHRGQSYESKGQITRGVSDMTEAIRLNPKFAGAYAARAEACQREARIDAMASWTTPSPDAISFGGSGTITISGGTLCLNGSNALAAAGDSPLNGAAPPFAVALSTTPAGEGVSMDWSSSNSSPPTPMPVYNPYGNPPALVAPSTMTPGGPVAPQKPDMLPTLEEVDALRVRVEKYWSTIKLGQDLALADYGEAIRLDPKNVAYYKSRAAIYEARHDNEKLLADLSEVIRLDPGDIACLQRRSQIYKAKRDFDKAIADVSEILRRSPTSQDALYHRAELYALKNDLDKAIADLTEIVRLNPTSRAAYERLAELYNKKHEPEKAAANAAIAARLPVNSTATYAAPTSGPYYAPSTLPARPSTTEPALGPG